MPERACKIINSGYVLNSGALMENNTCWLWTEAQAKDQGSYKFPGKLNEGFLR